MALNKDRKAKNGVFRSSKKKEREDNYDNAHERTSDHEPINGTIGSPLGKKRKYDEVATK